MGNCETCIDYKSPTCALPKHHAAFKDEQKTKRGKITDVKNPRAKKETLHAKITGTNSLLVPAMAVAPPPQAVMPLMPPRPSPSPLQQPPQPFPAQFDHQAVMRDHEHVQAQMRQLQQMQQQLFQYQAQLYAPQYPLPQYQQLPFQQLNMYGQPQAYTAAEAYQQAPVSSEAAARERMQRLKEAVMDTGVFTANRAPDHLQHIPAVQEAERMFTPPSPQLPPPVPVKRELTTVKPEPEPEDPQRPIKRVDIDLTH